MLVLLDISGRSLKNKQYPDLSAAITLEANISVVFVVRNRHILSRGSRKMRSITQFDLYLKRVHGSGSAKIEECKVPKTIFGLGRSDVFGKNELFCYSAWKNAWESPRKQK